MEQRVAHGYDPTPIARGGRVVLECDPPDAEVSLDGIPVGLCSDYASPMRSLSVGRGHHVIRIHKAGRVAEEREIAPDGAEMVMQAQLAKVGPRSSSP
jgi:hypothetical protein